MHPARAPRWTWLALILATVLQSTLAAAPANAGALPGSRLAPVDVSAMPLPVASDPAPISISAPISLPTASLHSPLAPDLRVKRRYLPLAVQSSRMLPRIKYAWKAVANPWRADAAGPALWGMGSWWYDWSAGGRQADADPQTATGQDAYQLIQDAMADTAYVPMIWAPHDVVPAQLTPALAAQLAAEFPGRAWLMFNEPDNDNPGGCGLHIKAKYPGFFSAHDWTGLGKYLAQQYIAYYDAIKAADPTARLFPLGLLQLPMPTMDPASVEPAYGERAIGIWNGFTANLQGRTVDGVAIHAYPNNASTKHTDCQLNYADPQAYLDPACVQRALVAAHAFFQGTAGTAPRANLHPEVTAGKPIWITEIGVLESSAHIDWNAVNSQFLAPMVTWFTAHITPTGDSPCINSVAWFSTHNYYTLPDGTVVVDSTASDLFDSNAAFPTLTILGATWAAALCPTCACPGPDCR